MTEENKPQRGDIDVEHGLLRDYVHYLQKVQPNWEVLRDRSNRSKNRSVVSITPNRKTDEEMFAQGKCYSRGPEMQETMFSTTQEGQQKAKKVCNGCPVQTGCLNFALEHPEENEGGSGVWGGKTAEERKMHKTNIAKGDTHPLELTWFNHPSHSRETPSQDSQ